jgi:hypothetical protein
MCDADGDGVMEFGEFEAAIFAESPTRPTPP